MPEPNSKESVDSGLASRRGNGKERLLEAGLELFAQGGYRGATIDQIVTRAGVSPPVLYHHYGTKEGLFVAVARDVYERVIARFTAVLEPDIGFEVALARVLSVAGFTHPDDPLARPMVLTVMVEMQREPSLAEELRDAAGGLRDCFEAVANLAPDSLVERMGGRRELRRVLVSLTHGLNVASVVARHPSHVQQTARGLCVLLGLTNETAD